MSDKFSFERPSHWWGKFSVIPNPFSFLRRASQADSAKKRMSIADVKRHVELSLQDIDTVEATRLRYRIRSTRDVNALWEMRPDVYQLVSCRISQQEAVARINALLPCFEHWMPAKALVKI